MEAIILDLIMDIDIVPISIITLLAALFHITNGII